MEEEYNAESERVDASTSFKLKANLFMKSLCVIKIYHY